MRLDAKCRTRQRQCPGPAVVTAVFFKPDEKLWCSGEMGLMAAYLSPNAEKMEAKANEMRWFCQACVDEGRALNNTFRVITLERRYIGALGTPRHFSVTDSADFADLFFRMGCAEVERCISRCNRNAAARERNRRVYSVQPDYALL